MTPVSGVCCTSGSACVGAASSVGVGSEDCVTEDSPDDGVVAVAVTTGAVGLTAESSFDEASSPPVMAATPTPIASRLTTNAIRIIPRTLLRPRIPQSCHSQFPGDPGKPNEVTILGTVGQARRGAARRPHKPKCLDE